MPTEALLFIIAAAYALGVLSALAGILVRHRRGSSRKDYPPKPHPHARRYKSGWRTDTLTWPDPPTERPSGPAPRPPTQPSRQVLTGYQPQRTNDEGTDDPGPPPTGDLGVESAAESDPLSTPLPPPSLPSRSMFATEREYRKAVRKQIAQQQPDETWVERPSMKTLEAEHEYKRLLRQKEIDQAVREQEAREARQREADAARSKPLEDNEVYGMMGHSIHPCNDGEVNRWPPHPPAPPPGEADTVTGSA